MPLVLNLPGILALASWPSGLGTDVTLPLVPGWGMAAARHLRLLHNTLFLRNVYVKRHVHSDLFVLPAVLFLLTLLIAACGPDTPTTPEAAVEADAVLQRSTERVKTLKSGSFSLEHEEGSTVLIPGIEMTAIHGVVEMPDRFSFTVETEISGIYAETDMVAVADNAYMTDFLTGQWKSVPKALLPFNFTNLGQTLVEIIQAVQSPVVVGTAEVENVAVYRVQGQINPEDLVTLVPAAAGGFVVELELWVAQTDGMLLKVLITGKVVDSDIPEAVRVLTLSDVDEPVEINLPE